MLLNKPKDYWGNQRGYKKLPRDSWQQKHNDPKLMRCSKSSSKKEVYSNIDLHQETRKISNIQSNLILKGIEKKIQSPKLTEGKKLWRSE